MNRLTAAVILGVCAMLLGGWVYAHPRLTSYCDQSNFGTCFYVKPMCVEAAMNLSEYGSKLTCAPGARLDFEGADQQTAVCRCGDLP